MLVFFIALGLVGTALLSIVYASLRDNAPGSAGTYQDDDNAPTFRVGDQVIWTDPVSIDGYQDFEWAEVVGLKYEGDIWIRTESGATLHVNACDLEFATDAYMST